ncbi:DUF86 domain-containing protein [Rhizobium sp. G21]|uniref:HepT-like ribonuclease domain-containing protein n=1 Tax=Rhizobium sp. G21 TaxID=2758439 RepID=UPI0015FF4B28|nr:HepT-like ribonuclease domain-containing protein [Rhizobium sp. G21]MBB1247502.1 DUF86 domain-containing protein [Rhizobium sp. G21]
MKHIEFHIASVIEALEGKTVDDYAGSYLLERATERAISIISEAAKLLTPELRDQYSSVPWMQIIGIGNLLRHEYERVDTMIMWDIARNHLPPMLITIRQMIAALDEADPA